MTDNLAHACLVCGTTLDGPLGAFYHVFGIERSARNPNICNRCDTHMQEGRIVELSVLFADLTAFTELTHRLGPERSYQVVDAFFKMANGALVRHNAFIDKYIGDAVMAFFNAPIRNKEHAREAAAAAIDIQEGLKTLRTDLNLDLQARVGVASGYARVGRVGSEDRRDYTAIGDVVNLAARLEDQALPGEVLVDARVYTRIAGDYPNVSAEILNIRGFPEPFPAHRIRMDTKGGRRVLATRQADPISNRPAVSVGAVLFSVLGAPCAATALLSPLALALGLTSLMGSLGPALETLDAAPIRIPLQVLAVAGALINLYVIWYGARQRRNAEQAGNGTLPLTRLERRRALIVAGLSVFSLMAVAFELYAHLVLMPHPLL